MSLLSSFITYLAVSSSLVASSNAEALTQETIKMDIGQNQSISFIHDIADNETLTLDEEVSVPEVRLQAVPDTHGGWNLHILTKNFKFAPEKVGKEDTLGEGHAHLYLNGKKLARVYGNWFYISDLPPGKQTLSVGLYSNGHKSLSHMGKNIVASIDVQGKARIADNTDTHSHD